jgi:hypothetical protein
MNEHCKHCGNGGMVCLFFDHITKRAGMYCRTCKRWLNDA